ncbi:hypothetical protein CYMTET_52637 [Cymbomonas tetramitiformis]|uniref:Retrovirus-related Pol polyprotein from transposon TNT 1-94-like beta-barrel domain-containing protein n=1 Tax=Cymbomonas tetramitiformis TaxID=36881 RepID=A0AAE0BJR5_9CHLO|nr:hypothetical protein CYMTET_52637 [Cymbomonas tetramitiformis]
MVNSKSKAAASESEATAPATGQICYGEPSPEHKPESDALTVVVSQQQAQINKLMDLVRGMVKTGATAPNSDGATSSPSLAVTSKTSEGSDAPLPSLSSMLKGIPTDRYFAGLGSESETPWLEFKARVAPSCRHPSLEILLVETRAVQDIKADPLYSDRANRLLYDFWATVTCQTAQGIVRAYGGTADGCAAWKQLAKLRRNTNYAYFNRQVKELLSFSTQFSSLTPPLHLFLKVKETFTRVREYVCVAPPLDTGNKMCVDTLEATVVSVILISLHSDYVRVLHPVGDGLPASVQAAPLVLEETAVEAECRRMPVASGPGCSQLRFEHLDAVFGAGDGVPAIQHACEQIVSNRIPAEVQPWIMGARLVALLKPGGGVRPIACGEVGVGVHGGAEVCVHSMQALLGAFPTWCALQLDCKNAFNTPVLRELLRAHPEVYIIAYLDDIHILGEPERVREAYDVAVPLLADIGLELNVGKSAVFSPSGACEAFQDVVDAGDAGGHPLVASLVSAMGAVRGARETVLAARARGHVLPEALKLGVTLPLIREVSAVGTGRCRCGGVVDEFGYHYLACNRMGMFTYRHDAVQDVLVEMLRKAKDCFITNTEARESFLKRRPDAKESIMKKVQEYEKHGKLPDTDTAGAIADSELHPGLDGEDVLFAISEVTSPRSFEPALSHFQAAILDEFIEDVAQQEPVVVRATLTGLLEWAAQLERAARAVMLAMDTLLSLAVSPYHDSDSASGSGPDCGANYHIPGPLSTGCSDLVGPLIDMYAYGGLGSDTHDDEEMPTLLSDSDSDCDDADWDLRMGLDAVVSGFDGDEMAYGARDSSHGSADSGMFAVLDSGATRHIFNDIYYFGRDYNPLGGSTFSVVQDQPISSAGSGTVHFAKTDSVSGKAVGLRLRDAHLIPGQPFNLISVVALEDAGFCVDFPARTISNGGASFSFSRERREIVHHP